MSARRQFVRALTAVSAVLIVGCSVLIAAPTQADHRLPNHGHWNKNSGDSVAHVKFLDSTGPEWPVGTAHLDWDQTYNLDADWETSGTCGADCVRVQTRAPADDPNFSPNCTGAAGYWTNGAPGTGNHWTQPRAVRFNRSCSDESAHDRRALTCQELGHALGLDHATVTTSCMFQNAHQAATTPRPHDYDMLNLVIYDHAN